MATDDRTPRQEAISLIIGTEGPNELYPILRNNLAARDPSLADELEAVAADLARFGQSGAASQLKQIARVMRATFQRIEELAQITTRDALLVLLRDSNIVWSPGFYELVETLAVEADTAAPERAHALRRGLLLRQEMLTGLEALDRVVRTPDTTYEALRTTSILRDPLFHEFVLLLARNNVSDPQQAEAFRRTISGLAECCRVFAEEQAQSGIRPLTFDEAAAWHLIGVSESLAAVMAVAASVAANGGATLQDVLFRLVSLVNVGTNDSARVIFEMMFLENACRAEPAFAPMFLTEMRRLSRTNIAYPDRQRATNALHYAMSLLLRWRSMPNMPEVLADAAQLLTEVLPEALRGPRLTRDLHWNRGQLLQNLGEWDPARFGDAISEFRAALATPQRLQHEHVARALILSDLANALQQHHLHQGTVTREVEDERQELYAEALRLLDSEAEPLRRAMVLGNVAIFLNERAGGDLGLNQERALDHVLEALRLISGLGEDDNPLIRAHRAGLERTRGNILYARLYGNPYEMAEAAIAAYDVALSYADESEHWLRGTIQLNRGNAYARLARLEARHAQAAYYSYEEARTLLRGDRITAAQASAGQASVMVATGSAESEAIAQLREAISEIRDAGGVATAAPLIFQLGRWMAADAETPEEFQGAATTLVEAIAASEGRGDLASAADAALSASQAFFSAGEHDAAEREARRSVVISETVWRRATSVEDRAEAGELWSSANAQLLWCMSTHGRLQPDEAWRLSDRSKPPELGARVQRLSHYSTTLDTAYAGFEAERRRLIAQRFRLQRERVTSDAPLASAIDAIQDAAADLDEMLSLLAREQRSATAAAQSDEFLRRNPTTIVLDVSVAASGSVLLIAGAAGFGVHCAPMTRGMLARAVSVWQSAYRNRHVHPDAWQQALEMFLAFLGEQLLDPVVVGLPREPLSRSTVIFIPGVLFGVPLHASVAGGTRLYELSLGFWA